MRDRLLSLVAASVVCLLNAASGWAQTVAPPQWIISTAVGNGHFGYWGDGGPAKWAAIDLWNDGWDLPLAGLSFDKAGNMYMSDSFNCVIRKVTPQGIISSIYGVHDITFVSYYGYTFQECVTTRPTGAAAGPTGDVYVTDGILAKVSPDGQVTTVLDQGGDSNPRFFAGVPAFDSQGNLYVSEEYEYRVVKLDPAGNLSLFAGNGTGGHSGDGGPAVAAELSDPHGILVDDADNVYILDSGYVRKVDANGVITTICDSGPDYATGFARDQAGNFYFSVENGISGVMKVDAGTTEAKLFAGGSCFFYGTDGIPAIDSCLGDPSGVATDAAGSVYVADPGSNAIRKITLVQQTAPPTFSPDPAVYNTRVQSVMLSDSTPNATIYYTLDGTAPVPGSGPTLEYIGGSINVDTTTTIRAMATAPGYVENSPIVTGIYTIKPPIADVPTFWPVPGKYIGSVTVTLNDTTPGAKIHYTLDGSTPLSSSAVYTGPLTLTTGTTVKAISTAYGYWKSGVVAAQYSVLPQTATPVISPPSGSYAAGQVVTISDATANATIRYTTDGSVPTASSRLYTGAFALNASATVQAIAISTGDAASGVATAAFTIP